MLTSPVTAYAYTKSSSASSNIRQGSNAPNQAILAMEAILGKAPKDLSEQDLQKLITLLGDEKSTNSFASQAIDNLKSALPLLKQKEALNRTISGNGDVFHIGNARIGNARLHLASTLTEIQKELDFIKRLHISAYPNSPLAQATKQANAVLEQQNEAAVPLIRNTISELKMELNKGLNASTILPLLVNLEEQLKQLGGSDLINHIKPSALEIVRQLRGDITQKSLKQASSNMQRLSDVLEYL
ncbi:MAG: hypothetical protein ACKO37_03705 [Vampirovibrionales bacterium]